MSPKLTVRFVHESETLAAGALTRIGGPFTVIVWLTSPGGPRVWTERTVLLPARRPGNWTLNVPWQADARGAEARAERGRADADRNGRHRHLRCDALVAEEDVARGAADVEDRRVADVEAQARDRELDHAGAVRPRRRLEGDVRVQRQV